MRIGRLFFAGAVFLGLAYFALRSPLPVADPRFIKEDLPGAGGIVAASVFLPTGYPRDQAHAQLADAVAAGRAASDPAQGLEDAAAKLAGGGIANLTLKLGDTLVVRGRRGEAPWRIGVRKPNAKGPNDVLGYLLEDRAEALASRYDDAAPDLRQVTVVAADAPTAAKAAQALFDAGAQRWPMVARKLGIAQALAVNSAGEIAVTQGLNDRIKFLRDPVVHVLP